MRINGLDLAALGFSRPQPHETGRPGYGPKDLLKLPVYGYMNRVRSSRRMETETKRNLEVIDGSKFKAVNSKERNFTRGEAAGPDRPA
ncbi:MAG: transposase [Treponema sp.]|jgi:transposase|nr:transposase [Treponema sp.]